VENLGTLRPGNPGKNPGNLWSIPRSGKLGKSGNLREATLGLQILGKTRENLENLGTLGVPLGLEILGETRENLENLGTLGVPPGLEVLGTLGARLGLENMGKIREPLEHLYELLGAAEKTSKIQEPWKYP